MVLLLFNGGMELRWQWLQNEATQIVKTVSANPEGFAHCQRFSETFMDQQPGSIGWVSLGETDKAVIKYNQCQDWWNVLISNKQNLTDRELLAVGVIIHEAHHVGGEYDEAVTQCKTIRDLGKILEHIGTPKTVVPKYVDQYVKLSSTMHSKYLGGVC